MRKIIWKGNVVSVPATRTLAGVKVERVVNFDFQKLKLNREGMFAEALNDVSLPLHASIANQTKKMLILINSKSEVMEVLNTPSQKLTRQRITYLYKQFEVLINESPTIKEGSRNTVSNQYRSVISKSTVQLKSGEEICDVKFRSSFSSHQSASGRHAAAERKAEKSFLKKDRFSSIPHDDEETLRAKMLEMMNEDLVTITSACWELIDLYKKTKKKHTNWVSSKLKKSNPQYFLIETLQRLKEENAYTYEGLQRLFLSAGISEQEKQVCHNTSNEQMLLALNVSVDLNKFNPFVDRLKKKISIHEFLYCQYFMPRAVIEAAQCLLIAHSAWNVNPVASLTLENIKKKKGFYQLVSAKDKNDSTEEIKIFKQSHPREYELIGLIVAHRKNVKRLWRCKDLNIWVTWARGDGLDYSFKSFKDGYEKRYISTPFGLPSFSKKDLRDMAANVVYLESNDPFLLKEKLGHSNINTTLIYINQHVMRVMNESNMKRFMDKLAATVVWASKGEKGLQKSCLSMDQVDDQLLFPVNEDGNSNTLADRWIESMGKLAIKIGSAEVEHLKWQLTYYADYSETLKQENPKRFLMYHVPRMLFSIALAELVKNSPYKQLLATGEKS